LIVSENYFPGWTASVDGHPALTDRVQYNLIGVQLPANAKVINLRFNDPAYQRGKAITFVMLLAAIGWLLFGVIGDRRRKVAD
jgi:uncharacterized membrane protein YfhO